VRSHAVPFGARRRVLHRVASRAGLHLPAPNLWSTRASENGPTIRRFRWAMAARIGPGRSGGAVQGFWRDKV